MAYDAACAKIDDEMNTFKNEFLLDFSTSAIDIDKFLEEILHEIFVKMLYEDKKSELEKQIKNEIKLINKLTKKLKIEELKNLNYEINQIGKNVPETRLTQEKRIYIFEKFIDDLINGKLKNSVAQKIDNISSYYNSGATMYANEKLMIEKILKLNNIIKECDKLKYSKSFQLGELFDITFIDHDQTDPTISKQNKLKDEITNFVVKNNKKLSKNEISLKLQELILKVEHLRVMIRNVASHKSILTQKSIEKGFNICIAEKSSIFNLIDELFGANIEKSIYAEDANLLLQELNVELEEETLNNAINKSI